MTLCSGPLTDHSHETQSTHAAFQPHTHPLLPSTRRECLITLSGPFNISLDSHTDWVNSPQTPSFVNQQNFYWTGRVSLDAMGHLHLKFTEKQFIKHAPHPGAQLGEKLNIFLQCNSTENFYNARKCGQLRQNKSAIKLRFIHLYLKIEVYIAPG